MAESLIHFFSVPARDDPKHLIRRIFSFLEPETIRVGRHPYLDSSWNRFRENLNDEGFSPELSLEPRLADEAIEEYQPEKWVGYDLVRCPIVTALNEEFGVRIAECVRGDHWPCETSLLVNPHDIFEDFINERGHYFARAFISLKLWGYSHPHDFAAYQEGVENLKTFQEIKRGLEEIIGDLDCVFYMRG